MSHGDRIEQLPRGFPGTGPQRQQPLAAMGDSVRRLLWGAVPPGGASTPRAARKSCAALWWISAERKPDWTPDSIIEQSIERIRQQVGDAPVLAAVSGGVDSSVAAALVHRAIGDQLVCVFVDTGLLRKDEREQVEIAFRKHAGGAPGGGGCRRRLS